MVLAKAVLNDGVVSSNDINNIKINDILIIKKDNLYTKPYLEINDLKYEMSFKTRVLKDKYSLIYEEKN